jgi:hypothetical protein
MADKWPSTSDAAQRSTQRWENEGGATIDVSAKRTGLRRQTRNADASSIAGPVIDGLADRSVTTAQQEGRKRRRLRGPKEFRDMRRGHRK